MKRTTAVFCAAFLCLVLSLSLASFSSSAPAPAPKPAAAPAPEAQPEMTAALEHLREAKRNLESASHDKGGHRAKALGHINEAIREVEAGIQFDNTHVEKGERH